MRENIERPGGIASSASGRAPLIAHVIYRLDVGGLENGLVNLINRMPADRFRHRVVCLTGATAFRLRITRPDVELHCLHKPPGNSLLTQVKLWQLLRRMRPDIVHTRNLAALECTVVAALAGCRLRIHGEHGRDIDDLEGRNARRRRIRRLFSPLVSHYVAVSEDLAHYLRECVGVPAARIARICNGVDHERFHPGRDAGALRTPWADNAGALFVVGSVGRMEAVKDPLNLVKAFLMLREMVPEHRPALRLAIAGDGALRTAALTLLQGAGAAGAAWLPGTCDDVPSFLRQLDLFVQPSLAEGISNTVLEAMASGLPVVATRVGGNAELVEQELTGLLVPCADPHALAEAMSRYVRDPALARRHGESARHIVEQRYGLDVMVRHYVELYERSLGRRAGASGTIDAERKADARCAG